MDCKMIFKTQSTVDYMIVGLGNPGKKYEGTRHNIGFCALDFCAKAFGITVNKNQNNALRAYNRSYIFPNYLNPSLQQNDTEISNEGLNFNLDYDKPTFKKRDQLEFGISYNYRKNEAKVFLFAG